MLTNQSALDALSCSACLSLYASSKSCSDLRQERRVGKVTISLER